MPPLERDEKKKLTLLRKEVINNDFVFFKELFFNKDKNHLSKNIVTYSFKYLKEENSEKFNNFIGELIKENRKIKEVINYAYYIARCPFLSKENFLLLLSSNSCHVLDDSRIKVSKIKKDNLIYSLQNIDKLIENQKIDDDELLNLFILTKNIANKEYENYLKLFNFLIKKFCSQTDLYYIEKTISNFQIENEIDVETAEKYLSNIKILIHISEDKYTQNPHGQTLKRLKRLKNWYLSDRNQIREILKNQNHSKSKLASLLID